MVYKAKAAPTRRKRELIYEEALSQLNVASDAHSRMLSDLVTRIGSIESFLIDELKGFTSETHTLRMMLLLDKVRGYEPAEKVELEDRVRVDLRFRMSSKVEFNDQDEVRRIEIQNVGAALQYPKNFEDNLVGLKVGEEKTFNFLEKKVSADEPLICWVKIVTISRKKEQDKPNAD